MQVHCRSPYQAEITLNDGKIHVTGSLTLIEQMIGLRKQHGSNPEFWPELPTKISANDLLINEFILKVKSQFKLSYEHAELCHCRMVPAEKVYEAIKQGCQSVESVGRTTLAGTGCGSCREDIEKLLSQFKFD